MMRLFKWTGAILLLILMSCALFRGPLFHTFFHFGDLHERPTPGNSQKRSSQERTDTGSAAQDVDACIDVALDETAETLAFTTGSAANDAAGALRSGRANCIGYAALFQRNCEDRLQHSGLSGEWRVLHLRGQLYCGSFNMHRLFSSPFWKDHDICAVENRTTGHRILVDPSLFDAVHIRRVSGPPN